MSVPSFTDCTWPHIEAVRVEVGALRSMLSVEAAAQGFTALLARSFSTVVLSRVFAVLPFSRLGADDQTFARRLSSDDPRLTPETRVLSLLGSSGKERDWNDRRQSKGHRAIPLLDRDFVQGIPMIAKLLADLQVDLAFLDPGARIETRRLLGSKNNAFYVPNAQTAVDEANRRVIPSADFVSRYAVRTVFGMGGAYVDGSLVFAIVFSSESIERVVVDRFPSLISNFKMATSDAQARGRVFQP